MVLPRSFPQLKIADKYCREKKKKNEVLHSVRPACPDRVGPLLAGDSNVSGFTPKETIWSSSSWTGKRE